ncbi:MAG: hypothetical protein JWO12_976 [Frankiales bacterium]|nr:hypothetical protein [Frankiales bacterium]
MPGSEVSSMQLRFAAPVAVLALAGATVPALATSSNPTAIEFAAAHQVRGDLGPATGAPTSWAAKALRAQAGRLGVDASTFRWELVRTSLIGTHVRGRQFRGGLPIEGTDVLVSAIAGRVAQVDAHGTSLPGGPAAAPVGELVAKAAALGHLKVQTLFVPAKVVRVLAPVGDRLVDTYQVSVIGRKPARAARVDVDAATGRVLAVKDSAKHADPTGQVFDPNPVVTSRNTKLRNVGETQTGVDLTLPQAELTAQLRTLRLQGVDATKLTAGILSGPYADIVAPVGYVPVGGKLDYVRTDPRFVGVMAYAHVDRYQRWLQSLGFKNVNNEPQKLIPTLVQGYDNSMYMPAEDVIVYGGGGVPDAEDAEVILHEYGHAIQDAQVPGYGATNQGGSMGEGFGDFDAANYYALTSKGFGDLCVAEWDSTAYSTTNPPCLRRMDSKAQFNPKVDPEVHVGGQMWSSFLWRLRSDIGTTTRSRSVNAITLVLTMHELLTPNANFADAVAGLRTAAKALRHPEWVKFVNAEAKRQSFPLNP